MSPSTARALFQVYEFVTFPIALIGTFWYFFVETPFFSGRMRGFESLAAAAREAEKDE